MTYESYSVPPKYIEKALYVVAENRHVSVEVITDACIKYMSSSCMHVVNPNSGVSTVLFDMARGDYYRWHVPGMWSHESAILFDVTKAILHEVNKDLSFDNRVGGLLDLRAIQPSLFLLPRVAAKNPCIAIS